MISLEGKDKAAVLAALYNNARVQGMGFMDSLADSDGHQIKMTVEQARRIFDQSHDKYFDYIGGHVLKVDLSEDSFDPWLYDRDNGEGAAAAAIANI